MLLFSLSMCQPAPSSDVLHVNDYVILIVARLAEQEAMGFTFFIPNFFTVLFFCLFVAMQAARSELSQCTLFALGR